MSEISEESNRTLESMLDAGEDSALAQAEARLAQAQREGRWDDAAEIQATKVDLLRREAATLLGSDPSGLADQERAVVHRVATELQYLGLSRYMADRGDSREALEESLKLAESIGDRKLRVALAGNLGRIFLEVTSLHDLGKAERWFRTQLEWAGDTDEAALGGCYRALGRICKLKFDEAVEDPSREAERAELVERGIESYYKALEHFPIEDQEKRADVLYQLGELYTAAELTDLAQARYLEALAIAESAGNVFTASRYRLDLAVAMAIEAGHQGKPTAKALEQAEIALQGFQSLGHEGMNGARQALQLIEELKRH